MNSHTTAGLRKLLAALPDDVRRQAAGHIVGSWTIPVTQASTSSTFMDRTVSSRSASLETTAAVGVRRSPDEIAWFWVGCHEEYENLLGKP